MLRRIRKHTVARRGRETRRIADVKPALQIDNLTCEEERDINGKSGAKGSGVGLGAGGGGDEGRKRKQTRRRAAARNAGGGRMRGRLGGHYGADQKSEPAGNRRESRARGRSMIA